MAGRAWNPPLLGDVYSSAKGGAMIEVKGTWAVVLALSAGTSLNANVIGTPKTEFRQSYALNPTGGW